MARPLCPASESSCQEHAWRQRLGASGSACCPWARARAATGTWRRDSARMKETAALAKKPELADLKKEAAGKGRSCGRGYCRGLRVAVEMGVYLIPGPI